ncbi:MAG TPA: sugar kinase [Puia sp.]|nr:sugar kinase [Puia sp.]
MVYKNKNNSIIDLGPKDGKVLSFGELLLRMCPDGDGEWLQQNNLPFFVGGAEANVATALALWGIPSAYLSVLPDNLMTRQIADYLQQKKIDTSRIVWQGQRMGLYFLPKGKDLKNAGVIYDRDHSAFSSLTTGTIDWDRVLDGVSWLHFSAISPALNARVAAVCEEALQAAAKKNITISVDLNYRAKLWQYGATPLEVMPGLVKYCDVIMGNLWAAEKMLGIPVDGTIHEGSTKEDYLQQALLTSEKTLEKFPRARIIANTFRFDRVMDTTTEDKADSPGDKGPYRLGDTTRTHVASGIHYYTALFADKRLYASTEHFADNIVDKVGSGDCYMAGLIYGLYKTLTLAETLEFATAAAFQKLFIASDATTSTIAEIEEYLKSAKAARKAHNEEH